MALSFSRRLLKVNNLRAIQTVVQSRNYAEASGSALNLTFGTPTQAYFNEEPVTQVDVPSGSGNFSILAQHVPIIAALRPGLMTVFSEGNAQKFFVSSGTITVNSDSSAQILAEEAQPIENFDADAARRTADAARTALASAADEAGKAEAQIQLDTCEALLNALEGK
ncbi:ATP synthase subunit delta, mitochondrial-like [Clytia hemisphaerica]|eukprot:TCONS_00057172-protein